MGRLAPGGDRASAPSLHLCCTAAGLASPPAWRMAALPPAQLRCEGLLPSPQEFWNGLVCHCLKGGPWGVDPMGSSRPGAVWGGLPWVQSLHRSGKLGVGTEKLLQVPTRTHRSGQGPLGPPCSPLTGPLQTGRQTGVGKGWHRAGVGEVRAWPSSWGKIQDCGFCPSLEADMRGPGARGRRGGPEAPTERPQASCSAKQTQVIGCREARTPQGTGQADLGSYSSWFSTPTLQGGPHPGPSLEDGEQPRWGVWRGRVRPDEVSPPALPFLQEEACLPQEP